MVRIWPGAPQIMISAQQLICELNKVGIPSECIQVFDEGFELVDPSWITHEFREAFEKALFSSGIIARDGQFDCNKIAKLCSTIADLCWYKTGKSDAVLAFGLIGVATKMHEVCIALHKNENGFYVTCYDPTPFVPEGFPVTDGTTMREVALTKEDYQSCINCIFV